MRVTEASAGVTAAPILAELFAVHYTGLVGLASLLGADDPEDTVQEAFARLHRRRVPLREPGSAAAYLRVTVCNLVRNRRRHLRIARLRQPPPPDPHVAAEQTVLVKESHRELIEALERLPARQREALVLRFWLDLSEREIAEAMGVSPGSVKTHARRGLAALNRDLGETST
jgi:RNA polymerase sigma-70 factor (sigma-E family)